MGAPRKLKVVKVKLTWGQFELQEAKSRVEVKTSPVHKALEKARDEIRALAGDTKTLLENANAISSGPALQVSGTTGISETQARNTWLSVRKKVAEAWAARAATVSIFRE